MKKLLLLLSIAALLSSAALGSNLVLNPGFETGDFTNWTLRTGIPTPWGVTTVGDSVSPHTGSYFADGTCVGAGCLDNSSGSYFYQDLPTLPGDTYTISFWYDLGDTIVGGGGLAELKVGWGLGPLFILDATADDQPDQGWVHFTINEMATSAGTQLVFLGRQDPATLGVDDVCVDLAGGACGNAAVSPEPDSLVLSGCGLARIGFLALRRSRSRRIVHFLLWSDSESRTRFLRLRFRASAALTRIF
jgi:hypothetical protein